MEQKELVVPARVSPAMFHEFGLYDTFSRQKKWRPPLVFALILSVSAGVCFTQVGRVQSAALLGAVLLIVGLGLPAVYVLTFLHSLTRQEKLLARNPDAIAYTLHLGEAGFTVLQGKEKMEHTWDDVILACRLERCMCLYVGPRRSYLLPGEAGDRTAEAAWARITQHVSAQRCVDRRPKV